MGVATMGRKKSQPEDQPKPAEQEPLIQFRTEAEIQVRIAELERKLGLPSTAEAEIEARIAALEREVSLRPYVVVEESTPAKDPAELYAEIDYALNLGKRNFPGKKQLALMLRFVTAELTTAFCRAFPKDKIAWEMAVLLFQTALHETSNLWAAATLLREVQGSIEWQIMLGKIKAWPAAFADEIDTAEPERHPNAKRVDEYLANVDANRDEFCTVAGVDNSSFRKWQRGERVSSTVSTGIELTLKREKKEFFDTLNEHKKQ